MRPSSLPQVLPAWCGIFILFASVTPLWPAEGGFSLYVSNEASGDITVIDGATHVEGPKIAVGKRPRGIHLSSDGRTLYVATSGSPRMGPGIDPERAKSMRPDKAADGIAIIDVAARRVVRRLQVSSDPEQFALTPDETRVLVSNEDEAAASCWDIATGRRIFTAPVAEEPEGVTLHPTRPEVYITCEASGEVFVLDQTDGREIARLAVGGRPRSVAFNAAGTRAYVAVEAKAEVAVIDTAAHRIMATVHLEGDTLMPMCVVVAPDGGEIYVSTGRGNRVAIIDAVTYQVIALIPVGDRPWGLALSPDGRTLYSANGLSNDVSVVDLTARKETTRIKAGERPWGLALGPSVAGAATSGKSH